MLFTFTTFVVAFCIFILLIIYYTIEKNAIFYQTSRKHNYIFHCSIVFTFSRENKILKKFDISTIILFLVQSKYMGIVEGGNSSESSYTLLTISQSAFDYVMLYKIPRSISIVPTTMVLQLNIRTTTVSRRKSIDYRGNV